MYGRSIQEVIAERFSCRIYRDETIEAHRRAQLAAALSGIATGPLGSAARFALIAGTEQDRRDLRGLGTYGFIRGATGYIVGATTKGPNSLEDFGYLMEEAVLSATELGLGTCWLGGTFTRSRFARRIRLQPGETIPAVAAVGHVSEGGRARDRVARRANAELRLPQEALFFDGDFGRPVTTDRAGLYATALEMVRRAPSASNKQPWRIVRDPEGEAWHFYLQRTKGYGKGTFLFGLLRLADLQRVDVGIAMCHFDLTARELGLAGRWVVSDPGVAASPASTEYVATWKAVHAGVGPRLAVG
jgi:nitroreductase